MTDASNWTEIKKEDDYSTELIFPHSGPIDEPFETCSYFNNKLYVGTSINGHLYKINSPLSEDKKIINDLGLLGGNLNTSIKALTNDGQYVYGASSENAYLFYIDSNDIIHKFAQKKLEQNQIRYLFCPQIFVTKQYQYIYFATLSTDSKLKLVRWKIDVDDDGNRNPKPIDSAVEIFQVGKSVLSDNYIFSIGITTLDGEPFIIGGTLKNQIIKHKIDEPNLPFKEIGPFVHNTFLTMAFSDFPDKAFIYADSYLYRYDFNTSTESNIKVNPIYEIWSLPLYKDRILYTHYQPIYLDDFRAGDNYKNGDQLTGRKLMHDETSNMIFGISKWGRDFPRIKKWAIGSSEVIFDGNTTIVPENYIFPYGGSKINTLAVYNGYVYGSMGAETDDFVWVPNEGQKKWIYQTYPTNTASSNSMLVKNDTIFYGNYNKPYFFYRADIDKSPLNRFEPSTPIDLQAYIVDESQMHVYSMKSFGNNIFMSTFPRNSSSNTRGTILRYSNKSFKTLGKVDLPSVTNIEVVQNPENKNNVIIYGAAKEGIFAFDYDLNSSSSPQNIPAETSIKASSVLCANNRMYALVNYQNSTYLFCFDQLPASNDEIRNLTSKKLKLNDDKHYESQMVFGNDGNLYLFYTTSALQTSRLEKIDINGSMPVVSQVLFSEVSNADHNKRISCIAVDVKDYSNKSLYVGFWKGNLKKFDSN